MGNVTQFRGQVLLCNIVIEQDLTPFLHWGNGGLVRTKERKTDTGGLKVRPKGSKLRPKGSKLRPKGVKILYPDIPSPGKKHKRTKKERIRKGKNERKARFSR